MTAEYIRSSSYNNWEYCELQYFITYNLGYQSPSGKKAQLGTMIHKVMECLAACTKDIQDNPSDKKTSRVITDDALGEISFTDKKLKTKKFVKDLLERSIEWYSSNDHHSYTPADTKFCQKQRHLSRHTQH